ncbi:glycosyltransferase [Staphylococcus canis]|uniref:Glycosyltransferase family 4 protein n=1 Tax=Staphylococcus canis TaxID=2724942 RepID=A0ABS0TA42_9STAP|nr:glycosyltransferase [Staphylococcus canis]MBI5975587.1 glycosyltransferase family 4 protein [Staphylococcus canis]
MRILDVVSSNIVLDPRVLKQIGTIKQVTDDYLIIGKMNHEVTDEHLKDINYNYKLFGKRKSDENIVMKVFNRIKFGINVIKTIKSYQPDVIHANDFDTLFMVTLSGFKGRIIYDAHEIYSKNAFVNKFKLISNSVQRLEKSILKHVDHFITVSHAAKQYYIDQGYVLEPIVVTNAPNAYSLDYSSSNFDKKEIVYQGRIVNNRGFEEFVQAAKLLGQDNAKFVVRGFGPLEETLKEIASLNYIKNIKFDDPVSVQELVPKLTESTIGVVLTKGVSINFEYTVSNKIFECIQAGLPVILSPVKEHIYLNEKYNFGIVIEAVTPENIANAIKTLLNDEVTYNKLRQNAIEASKVLNWENESEILKVLYSNNLL